MRLIVFCDEYSIEPLALTLKDLDCLFVVAHNREKAIDLAESLNVSFLVQPGNNDPKRDEFLRVLQSFEPHLGICCSYGLKLEAALIQIPHLGCVNFHGGILPYWRGANILNWVLIQGAKETGVTAHFMTEGIDEGPIIDVKTVEILHTDTALSLQQKLASITYPLIGDVIAVFESGRIPESKPQNESAATYYSRRTPDDGRIRWNMTDLEIHNLIRALVHPWPGAFLELVNNQTLIIDSYISLEAVAALRETYQPLIP
jgi:methionyl-tRNA formyltransferase